MLLIGNFLVNINGKISLIVPNDACCIFPFTYGGVSYNECTTEGSGDLWCATEVYGDGSYKYYKTCDETCSGRYFTYNIVLYNNSNNIPIQFFPTK